MRDEEARAGITREEILQPLDRARVEMVGRLVENEKIRAREKRAAERDAALLTARKRADNAAPRPARADCVTRLRMRCSRFQPSTCWICSSSSPLRALSGGERFRIQRSGPECVARRARMFSWTLRRFIEIENLRQVAGRQDRAAA